MGLKTDRSIVLQKKKEGRMRYIHVKKIRRKLKATHKPGYVSSSCNNGILRHGCHTTHSLTISTKVIHLTPPDAD